ncbi:MAG: sugar nucleotide-binding protein, partial [Thermohalobaculum sp.]|nr:sugar nucleotide-binding protein [Thermohalobaculum sp.]
MTLRLLMFGRTGQLAREVLRRAGDGIAVTALDRDAADLGDPARCADLIARAGADVVLNAAAFTAVDLAEAEEARALRINAEAPGAMAQAAAARGLPFLHISSDYVFDGTSPRPWREDDPVAPLNAYGRTKLAGERAVAAAGGPHVILRTAWVHAGHGRNFVASMLRAGAAQPRLRVVADQHGGPTPAGALAGAALAIARAFAAGCGV